MPPRAASLHARSAVKALALSEQRDVVGDPARTIAQKRKGAPRVAEDNGALVEYLRQEVQKRKKAAAQQAGTRSGKVDGKRAASKRRRENATEGAALPAASVRQPPAAVGSGAAETRLTWLPVADGQGPTPQPWQPKPWQLEVELDAEEVDDRIGEGAAAARRRSQPA